MYNASIIDSDSEFCGRLKNAIESYGFCKCSGCFTTCREALEKLPKEKPDVILMDINFPGAKDTPGTCAVKILLEKIPGVKIIILTNSRDTECLRSLLNLGISGFFPRDITASLLNAAIKTALGEITSVSSSLVPKLFGRKPEDKNPVHLSPQMIVILHYLGEGYTYKEIAVIMEISESSVNKQIERMYEILDVHCKIYALKKGKELGFI